jgi:uncharacterized membrane protein YphA (DoxX/SURF4 family)
MYYTDLAFLVGRLIFGGYFVMAAVRHLLTQRTAMVGYAKMKKAPMPDIAVPATGILLLLGGLGIIFWIYAFWAILALLLFLIPTSFIMHAYWRESDANMKMGDQINFWKNMALVGALLMFLSLL